MTACPVDPRPPGVPLRSFLGGWLLLLLFLPSACITSGAGAVPRAQVAFTAEASLGATGEYAVDFLESGTVSTQPVPLSQAEFQQALVRLAHEVRLARQSPRQAARELLRLVPESHEAPTVEAWGEWTMEQYDGRGYTFTPERQEGPVTLSPLVEHALQEKYLRWCVPRGGGDCLGLLDDGTYLRTDDRRTLALALAFGSVLDETYTALGRELDARALVALVVWTVALYCMMWTIPEPTTKAVAATLTVILMGWLGLQTVYGLMDGWARMAEAAHEATTFEELRAAGEAFGKTLGEDAARAMILAAATLSGRTLGEVAARVKSLPGYSLAEAQWEAQRGAAVMGRVDAPEMALASEGALAQAVSVVETVATSPQGPLAVVMFKKGPGGGVAQAPGGRSCKTVLRHRGGNQQVELSDSFGERDAIKKALKQGKYWLARLLEREARGRFVHETVSKQLQYLYRFNRQGVDAVDLATGHQYEILSNTESNLARHGRRMSGEFFRMLTF